jgi:hypothetical protein
MQGAKAAVYIAAGSSSFAVIAILLIIPSLYQQINELQNEVMEGMSAFKVELSVLITQ